MPRARIAASSNTVMATGMSARASSRRRAVTTTSSIREVSPTGSLSTPSVEGGPDAAAGAQMAIERTAATHPRTTAAAWEWAFTMREHSAPPSRPRTLRMYGTARNQEDGKPKKTRMSATTRLIPATAMMPRSHRNIVDSLRSMRVFIFSRSSRVATCSILASMRASRSPWPVPPLPAPARWWSSLREVNNVARPVHALLQESSRCQSARSKRP